MSSRLELGSGKGAFGPSCSPLWTLLVLSFQTLGIVYADLGTSPLYTLNGLWPASGPVPSEEDVIGGLSAIVWAITLLPLCKYVFICLRFGTGEGEGGTFALFQGLYPPQGSMTSVSMSGEYMTKDSITVYGEQSSSTISRRWRIPLLVWCLFGTSLTLADGIFTPAVSVTSAVAGIAVAKPSISSSVIPISIAFLVVFFLVQSRGTSQLGYTFAPVLAMWLILIAVTGIINITEYPGVFRAFDPSRAVMLFVRTKDYDILAGVLLALTGCEAMFASMGHFTAGSIQLSFTVVVYPSVIFAYLGQGARLIKDKEAVLPNLFYTTIPGPKNGVLFWIMFVFAILATFIASQTLVTATFSLVQQLMSMHVFPPLRVVHTSETIKGQVYIPAANYTLMILTIIVVATFKNSVSLTNAFGFSVATVMFSTTILIAIQMQYVKHWPVVASIGFLLIFGFLDGLFWGAALKKIPLGAWVPLMIGIILVILMLFWSWAKGLEDKLDTSHLRDLHRLITRQDPEKTPAPSPTEPQASNNVNSQDEVGGAEIEAVKYFIRDAQVGEVMGEENEKMELVRLPTCAIFHKLGAGTGVPPSFLGFIQQWPALPRVVMFLSVKAIPTARVPLEERYSVHKIRAIDGFYGVSYYIGFQDHFDFEVDEVVGRICAIEAHYNPQGCAATIKEIQDVSRRSTHVVPHYLVIGKKIEGRWSKPLNICRSFLIEEVYRRMKTMFPETVNWLGSAAEVINVGVTAAI